MSGAATAAVGKFAGLTTGRSGRFGLTLVTGGLTGTDTQPFGEAGPRARTDSVFRYWMHSAVCSAFASDRLRREPIWLKSF